MSHSDLQAVKTSIIPSTSPKTTGYYPDHKILIGFAIVAVIFLSGVITAAFLTNGEHTTMAFKAEVITPAVGVPLACATIPCIVAYLGRHKDQRTPIQDQKSLQREDSDFFVIEDGSKVERESP